jgi:hypothetical protein
MPRRSRPWPQDVYGTPSYWYHRGVEEGGRAAKLDLVMYRKLRELRRAYERDAESPMAYPNVGEIAERHPLFDPSENSWWKEGFVAGYWEEIREKFSPRAAGQRGPLSRIRVEPYFVQR